MNDLSLLNAVIADGSGHPLYCADIGIKDGFITEIGDKVTAAKQYINAKDLIICPGFIDIHSHADLFLLRNPHSLHRIKQGVTTEVIGNCGFSAAPSGISYMDEYYNYALPIFGSYNDITDIKNISSSVIHYKDELRRIKTMHNVGVLTGCGAVRVSICGFRKDITDAEFSQICSLTDDCLKSGVLGLSMGLMYVPEAFYTRSQLIKLAQIASDNKKPIFIHLRGEGNLLIDSLNEMIDIAKITSVSLHISHFKSAGGNNWGSTNIKALQLLDKVRNEGIDITSDVYPYDAGSTTLLSLLPPWSQQDGNTAVIKRLKNSDTRARIIDELNSDQPDWDNYIPSIGWSRVIISSAKDHPEIQGMTISELSKLNNLSPTEYALNLLIETKCDVSIIIRHMDMNDVIKNIKHKNNFIISDSLYGEGGKPHPRKFGSFAMAAGNFVNDGILSLEEAVKKCTSMPAKRIGLQKRGLVKQGYYADLLIFDPDTFKDKATYTDPTQYPSGICYVFVNGIIVLVDGKRSEFKPSGMII